MGTIFINILQGKTGRWIKNQSNGEGLYTDEITTCKILVFFGKKNGNSAISMTHYDSYADVEDIIKTEKAWFDQVNNLCICSRDSLPNDLSKKIKSLYSTFKPIIYGEIEEDTIVAFIDTQEKPHIDFANTQNIAKYKQSIHGLINHPDACKIYAYYKFNIMLQEVYGQLKTNESFEKGEIKKSGQLFIYEGKQWTTQELSKHFQKAIEYQDPRILFDGEKFSNTEEHFLKFTSFAEETTAAISEKLAEKTTLSFKDIYQAFMAYFHSKEPNLSAHQVQQYYDFQCSELARFYCYLMDKMELLMSNSSQAYWVEMMDRYSTEPKQISPGNSIDKPSVDLLAKSLESTLHPSSSSETKTATSNVQLMDPSPSTTVTHEQIPQNTK